MAEITMGGKVTPSRKGDFYNQWKVRKQQDDDWDTSSGVDDKHNIRPKGKKHRTKSRDAEVMQKLDQMRKDYNIPYFTREDTNRRLRNNEAPTA